MKILDIISQHPGLTGFQIDAKRSWLSRWLGRSTGLLLSELIARGLVWSTTGVPERFYPVSWLHVRGAK